MYNAKLATLSKPATAKNLSLLGRLETKSRARSHPGTTEVTRPIVMAVLTVAVAKRIPVIATQRSNSHTQE